MIVKLRNIFAKVRLKLYNPPCPPVTPRWGNVQLTNFLFTCLIVSSLFDNSKNFQKLFQSCIFIPPNNCRFAKQWRYLIWTTRSTLFDLWIYLPSIHKLWCLDINVSKPSPKVRRYLLHAPPVPAMWPSLLPHRISISMRIYYKLQCFSLMMFKKIFEISEFVSLLIFLYSRALSTQARQMV